jgi:toxin YoeB
VRLVFTSQGWADYQHWVTTDGRVLKRVNRLVAETLRTPFEGIGKPEPLQHVLAGAWSRRIDAEHRLVYLANDDDLVIIQARYHYAR